MKTTVLSLSFLFLFASPVTAQNPGTHTVLPENLAFFTASRFRNTVSLQWQTVNEQNSKGFAVQRKTTGPWEEISFLPSNSGGNSSARVSYSYGELNMFRGVSQYRVAEVTNAGKRKWSEIRAVRGESQTGKLSLYPNPTNDGRVTLVFDNSAVRDISVNNVAGCPIRQFTAIQTTTVAIENLSTGFYFVRIYETATNEVSLEKIVVTR